MHGGSRCCTFYQAIRFNICGVFQSFSDSRKHIGAAHGRVMEHVVTYVKGRVLLDSVLYISQLQRSFDSGHPIMFPAIESTPVRFNTCNWKQGSRKSPKN